MAEEYGFYTREGGVLVYHSVPLTQGPPPTSPTTGQVPTWDTNLQRYVPTSLGAGAYAETGTTAGTVAAGNDPRLSDQRTPIDGSVTTVKLANDAVTAVKILDGAVGNAELATDAVTNIKVSATAAISLDKTADSATRTAFLATERTKLTGIATGATANSTDAQLRDRTTHTGVTPVGGIGTGTAAAGRYVDGGTGAWTALPTPPSAFVRTVKSVTASYTLVAGDLGAIIEVNSATAVTITLPASVLAAGSEVRFIRVGTGTVTFAAGTGATVNTPSVLTMRAQWSTVDAIARSATAFVVDGDLG